MGKKWDVGMEGEKDGRVSLPDGICTAEIVAVELCPAEPKNPAHKKDGVKYSKSGNPFFLWTLGFPAGELEVRTTLIKGKRWLLKQILSACGIFASEDDPEEKYSFGAEDVVGKLISVNIVNKESSFTGREGNEITTTKSEVNRIIPVGKEASAVGGKKRPDDVKSDPATEEEEEIPF